MKLVRGSTIAFIPASHEDSHNPGVYKKVLLKSGVIQDGKVEMVNWARLPKGKSFALHFHEDMDEAFIIISGSVQAKVGSEEFELFAGDALVVPKQTTHMFHNISEIDVEYIVFGISNGKGGKTVNVK